MNIVDCRIEQDWLDVVLRSLRYQGYYLVTGALDDELVASTQDAMYEARERIQRDVGQDRLERAGELGVFDWCSPTTTVTLPPGKLLQHLHARERPRGSTPGVFVEIGTGTGELAHLLVTRRLEHLGWRVQHVAGLTFPLSNILLPLSNRLVRRAEGARRALGGRERTRQSGNRHVAFKTHFPSLVALILNERALRPFRALQKPFVNDDAALVLYVEARPAGDRV